MDISHSNININIKDIKNTLTLKKGLVVVCWWTLVTVHSASRFLHDQRSIARNVLLHIYGYIRRIRLSIYQIYFPNKITSWKFDWPELFPTSEFWPSCLDLDLDLPTKWLRNRKAAQTCSGRDNNCTFFINSWISHFVYYFLRLKSPGIINLDIWKRLWFSKIVCHSAYILPLH